MGTINDRSEQMFPMLSPAQFEVALGFASGSPRPFRPGAVVSSIGARNAPIWLILEGSIVIVRRDGLGHEQPVRTLVAGQFTGEVSQLAGGAAIAEGSAGAEGCSAAPLDAVHLRALLIGSAELGEIVMRALILRRADLIGGGAAGSVLVGSPQEFHARRLQSLLTRNGYPNTLLDVDGDAEGQAVVDRLGLSRDDLPVMICPNGAVLRRPTDMEAAVCLGLSPELDPQRIYDVAVVGAGPAGLATAVYAASEGLSVVVLDQRAYGGQAGASARIENYLGFPTGISGQALAARAYNQALKFGVEMAIPLQVARITCPDARPNQPIELELTSGEILRAATVVIASGARYRRPQIANLELFEGTGVSYWATPVEARLCAGEAIALVGAGNSAGQAVVFLAPKVSKLHLVVRGSSLEATMSSYLVERIAALHNVEVHARTEIVALDGARETGLQAATCRHRDTGDTRSHDLRHLFLFIGADPNADWLSDSVALDDRGFVITGASFLPLQTSRSGVFAIGDVRAGSTKRVAAAVGEGAAVVTQIHSYLAALRKRP